MTYQCQHCQKSFARERTLVSHVCEQKRRFQQENEIGVQWALQSYKIFYAQTQSTKERTYQDFIDSPYYTAFVRFGRYCHDVHCVNFIHYTKWLLKHNRKLDQWCSEENYSEWILDYIRNENVSDALERSIKSMVDYMHDHPEYRNGYIDYFRLVNENRICYHIITGRISPWVIFNSQSGQDFLEKLNDEQIASIIEFISPDYWQNKFYDEKEDQKFVRQVLKEAGL